MKETDGFCEECLCFKCGNKNCCGTWGDNTKWYCDNICRGDVGCMTICSQYDPNDKK